MIKNNVQSKEVNVPSEINIEDLHDVPEVDTDYVLSQ